MFDFANYLFQLFLDFPSFGFCCCARCCHENERKKLVPSMKIEKRLTDVFFHLFLLKFGHMCDFHTYQQ